MPRSSPARPVPGHSGPVPLPIHSGPIHTGPVHTGPAHVGPTHAVPGRTAAVRTGPVPVLHEPPDGPPGVLVGLDGSDGSVWALDRAFAEAVAHRLPLYVVSAVDPAPAGYPPGMANLTEDSVDRLFESMGQVALRAIDAVRANHPPLPAVTVHVMLGSAVDALLRVSAAHRTLVVGARGNGGFERLLLGSVATAVIHHSACPVLVVPASPAEYQTEDIGSDT
ncbi:universal stress protein [Streptacidiphilus carbonis]|uniref:universal stress protein n=1 Tax=Streptacidiphilus carbonis TaxID=105422 RepID=UPI000694A775|nr:universal stress protein [Streptacidiphilus carbonis]